MGIKSYFIVRFLFFFSFKLILFNINRRKKVIYRIYNRQIDDQISKYYTKNEKERERERRKLYRPVLYTQEEKHEHLITTNGGQLFNIIFGW